MKDCIILFIIFCISYILTENSTEKNFTVLKYDKDFIKPKIKLAAEFELIQMKNGMKGLLINDLYTTYSHVHFNIHNGSSIDSYPGISHLHEHMALSTTKNYNKSYHILRNFGGISGYSGGATSGYTTQEYFYTLPFNFRFEKGLKMITDSFINPLYPIEHISHEIQAINAEFYINIDKEIHILDSIIRKYSNKETPINLMATGTNQTLNPNESDSFSKKLKSYFNIFMRPENFFFVLYSNMTLQKMESYCEKYFNYKMNEFPDDEIDIEEKEILIKNIEKMKDPKLDLFRDEIFLSGFYFNSHSKKNKLSLSFYLKDIYIDDFNYDIFEFFSFLFQSESLLNLLKSKNYIASIHDISTGLLISIHDRHLFEILLDLSQNGLDNIDDVLLILYKYIDIIKREGYKKKYFYNFVKYRKNYIIKKFNKEMFTLLTSYSEFIENYRYFGEEHILDKGTPDYKEYDEIKLKNLLNKINFEKSFFIISTQNKLKKLNTFLESIKTEKLEYFNINYLYGKYPDDFIENIKEKNEYMNNLYMRKINPYFSEKEDEVIPCYKKEINECKILNEFDYENDEKYNGILLEENNKQLKIYYQIDKSSESYLIKANLEIHFDKNEELTDEIIDIIKFYIDDKLSIINEGETISIVRFDKISMGFNLITFKDNTKIIYEDFLGILKKVPNKEEFKYAKESSKINKIEADNVEFKDYIIRILNQFMSGGYPNNNIKKIINSYENINYDYFINLYKKILFSINSITLKIAGNLDLDLVNTINNFIKKDLPINIKSCEDINENNAELINKNINNNQQENTKEQNYIIDYYQKSEMKRELDGAIFVIYRFKEKLNDYMQIFKGCMDAITRVNLRLKYMHSYHPNIFVENNFFMIFEQGRYKEPNEMEEEIDQLLLDIIEGKIVCENYNDIVKSFKTKQETIIEKNPDNLFNEFITGTFTNDENVNAYLEGEFPDKFEDLIKEISSVFTEPKRYTILVFRSDISDKYYEKIIKKKKKVNVYILNKSVGIFNTDNISILRPKN